MAESIRFDFLSTGADRLARDFKSTGDNAAAAARGAAVLQKVITDLGQKEGRTAAESRLLAKALNETGDAEDRAAAKALRAEIAISRLDEELKKNERAALEAAAANRTLGDSLDSLADRAGGASLKGSLLALSPALIPVTGGIAAGVGAIGVSFGAAAVGAGLFGALVKSVFANVSKDNQKYETAQKQLAAAQIARSQATTKAQRQSADNQIAAAQDTIASIRSEGAAYNQVLDLSKEIGVKWKVTSAQIASPVLVPWLSAVSKGISDIRPLVQPVADQFQAWGQAVDRYFSSSAGSTEITRLATSFGRFSADQLSAIGVFITDVGKGVFNLGRYLAASNPDFGAFSVHLDQWGGAFLRWSQSASARQDVSKFLAWISANGPQVAGLLKNAGSALAAFAPGLSSVGELELRLVSDFLGFLGRTPKFIAQPLIDTAGALLLLQKTGVLSIGIKVVGAAAKWLSGGAINLGGGAAAGAEIRAAMVSGGAAAAAEIRAAMAGGGVAAGAGGTVAGGGAAGATAGKAAAGGFAAAFRAALSPALAGVVVGAVIRSVGDTLSPAGSFAGKLNKNFQDDGHMWSSSLLHSFTFGGLEAWLTTKIGEPVGQALNNVGSFVHGSWTKTQHDTTSIWNNISGFLSGSWHKLVGDSGSTTGKVRDNFSGMSDTILGAMRRAGQATDNFRTRNLTPVLGAAGRVSGGIQGLQKAIDGLHGKTFSVTVDANGYVNVNGYKISAGAYFSPHAAGGFISGGVPGRDSVPAMLMPGEVVVPTGMVQAGAVDHLRGALPGFAAGGVVGTHGNLGLAFPAGATGNIESDAIWATDKIASAATKAFAAYAKKQKAAIQSASAGAPGALGGPASAGAAQAQAYARSRLGAYGWGSAQMSPLIALWNQESGWNRLARNPSSGAYGIPQALPASKMGAAANPPTSSAAAQINWGLGYIKGRYGSPAGAEAHERAFNWYGRGGRVPGYASGGTVASRGRAWLNAWQSKHGGGFGAAWAPVPVNEQIARMSAAIGRAKALASASGLSPGQHRFWASAAADEARRLGVLKSELTTERAWRNQLGLNELALDKEIRAAGGLKSLAGPVSGWKSQLAKDKSTVAAISKMLGYSDAYLKAHPAKAPGPVLPPVTHQYGGDVADVIAPILAGALTPVTYDQGGWLRPGFTPVWNGTGRPEAVVPSSRSGGGGTVVLQVESSGTEFDQFLTAWLRKHTKVKGGGDVQVAWGSRLVE